MSRGSEPARELSEKAKEFLMNPERYMWKLQKENERLKAEIERKDKALRSAKRFIENGIEFGYIRDPEPPDSACDTLPYIIKALSEEE